MNRAILLAAVLLIAGLPGCGTPPQVTEDTRLLSLYVQKVRKDADEFAAFRNVVAKARSATIDAVEVKAINSEQAARRAALPWELAGDKRRTELFNGLRKASESFMTQREELRQLQDTHRKSQADMKSAVTFRTDKLGQTATALAKMAEPRSVEDEVRFYVGFFQDVNEKLEDKSKQDASANAQEAVKEAAKKPSKAQ